MIKRGWKIWIMAALACQYNKLAMSIIQQNMTHKPFNTPENLKCERANNNKKQQTF